MKIVFNEYKQGAGINLEPETPKEMASLIRLIKNLKKEPISISLNLDTEGAPSAWISLRKITPNIQSNYISTYDKKK